MESILKRIEYGDLLLGMLHGFGLALDVHPGAGTLYINARSIVESRYLSELKEPIAVFSRISRHPKSAEIAFCQLEDYLYAVFPSDKDGNWDAINEYILGAATWIGVSSRTLSELNNCALWYGAAVAQAVIEVQHVVDSILNRLSHHVLLDQTNLANIVLGNPPDDAARCWLVTKWLADKLRDHTQEVVHQIGTTHWWQQEYPLTDTTKLIENPALQRVANSMVAKKW